MSVRLAALHKDTCAAPARWEGACAARGFPVLLGQTRLIDSSACERSAAHPHARMVEALAVGHHCGVGVHLQLLLVRRGAGRRRALARARGRRRGGAGA